jgi:uncharacterized membrane protein
LYSLVVVVVYWLFSLVAVVVYWLFSLVAVVVYWLFSLVAVSNKRKQSVYNNTNKNVLWLRKATTMSDIWWIHLNV